VVWEVCWQWLQSVVAIFNFLGLILMQQSFWFSILSRKAWLCILSTIFRCPSFSISFKSCILSDAQLSHLAFWHSILRSFSSSTISSWLGPSYNSKESIVIHKFTSLLQVETFATTILPRKKVIWDNGL